MNSIITNHYPLFEMYQALRNQLIETLDDDADLNFRLAGENLSFGALCREIGEVEHAYIESFKTFKQDFSYRNPEPDLESSLEKLVAWYADLDTELEAAVARLSEDDIQNRLIDRGGFTVPPRIQLEIYKEALLIFYGKASVYLKAMGKTLPEQWQDWIC